MNIKKLLLLFLVFLLVVTSFPGCGKTDNVDYSDKLIGDDKGEEDDGGLLQGPLGASGKKVYEYEGLIGCGYDVINSPYYQSEYVKQCVLDVESMAENGLIYEDLNSQTTTEYKAEAGEDIHTYMSSLASSAGMTTKSLFGGSVKVDFGLDTSAKVDENRSFAKGSATIVKSKQYVQISKVSYKTLRNKYVLDGFKEDWLLNEKVTPEELFKNFGTHIMLTVYLGGRLDMNYVYNNVSKEDSMAIRTKVEASYSFVEGYASTDITEKTNSLINNSSFRIKSYGGNVNINMTNLENAKTNYAEWSNSIQDTDQLTLIKAGRLDCITEMFPIWMLIDPESSTANKKRYNELLDEFNKQLEEAGKNLDRYQSAPKPLYIKDIYFGAGGGSEGAIALSDLRSKTTESLTIIQKDLNQNAGGNDIFLGYTTTTNPDEAIRGITLRYGGNPPATLALKGATYTLREEYDLNRRAGGYDIFLYYTKDKKAGEPLKALFIEVNGDSSGMSGEGWSRVGDWEKPKKLYDLNEDAGGAYIYLWMQK